MNNALLKDNLAARAVDSQTRKVFSRSGLIAGLCLSSLVSSYAIPGGVDATKAKNESVMITQQAKRVSGVVTDSAGEPIPGANVVQKETTNGTVTDMNGKYTLDVPNVWKGPPFRWYLSLFKAVLPTIHYYILYRTSIFECCFRQKEV